MSIGSEPVPFLYRDGDDGPVYVWHGGAYIDICYHDGHDWVAADNINVWDYETGMPSIEISGIGFLSFLADHLGFDTPVHAIGTDDSLGTWWTPWSPSHHLSPQPTFTP